MPATRCFPDVVTLTDPRPGTVVTLAAGSRLNLRLRSGRWYVAAQPGNLLLVVREESELSFFVFDGEAATLRLERRLSRGDVVGEVCEVRVEVGADDAAMAGRRDTMPIFTAPTSRSENTASICAVMNPAGASWIAVTPLVFCAVKAVITLAP